MTARAEPTGDAPGTAAARWTLALALGVPVPDEPAPWDDVLALAEREGCAPLCWTRGAATIRARAPRAVADGFRARTFAVRARAERQLATLAEVLRTLEDADAAPVALKGAALARLAHGDPLVRQSADVDVLVPRAARGRARAALEAAGWRCVQGAAPWEETWLRGADEHLEVQSALFGEMLVHLEPAVLPVRRMVVGDVAATVLAPAALPAYLAVHLSRHRLAPLLWLVDLACAWSALSQATREEALRFAARCGVERYLAWGLELAEAARAVARGDAAALGGLGAPGPEGRAIGHPAGRDLRFAPGLRGALRVAIAWAVPPTTRERPSLVLARARHRLRRIAGAPRGGTQVPPRAPTAEPGARGAPVARALDVTREELGNVVADVVGAGGSLWMRVHGRSMRPAIPSESLVHLVPLPDRALRPGEVVLARLPDGSFALHRVLGERDGRVRLRGDAVVTADPPVPRGAVLALADRMDAGRGIEPVSAREPLTAFRLLRPLRRLRMRLRARLAARARRHDAAGVIA